MCWLDFLGPAWYERPVADENVELEVRLVADGEVAWYNDLMREHHGLGVAASGRVLRYVAQAGGVPLVLGTFGSAAWRVPARDAFIGWDPVQRAERLERVISNQRLCVLPAAGQVPFAASRALAAMLRRLPGDHEAAFGVRPAACESFTDPSAHAGTAYKACGFTEAGRTAGYGRTRGAAYYHRHGQPKAYWIKELAPGGLAALRAAFDSRPLTGRPGPDFNKLNMSQAGGSLLEYLAKVSDHRKPKGVRHDLAAILVVVVVARLSGADSVYAAAQFARTMPQQALARCGIRFNKRLGRYVPPATRRSSGPSARSTPGPPMSRCAPGCAPRPPPGGCVAVAAHRRRRQDGPRRPRRRPGRAAPAVRLRRHRRHRPGPGQRRGENQRDQLLRPPAASHPRRPRPPRPR